MGHHYHGVAQDPEGDKALLAILKTPIFYRVGNAGEHVLRVGEIEPVLTQINAMLGLVPHDLH